MRLFGSVMGADGAVRLAPAGTARKQYTRRKEPDKEDIERCLNCTKKKCGGCWTTHEGKRRKNEGQGR